MLSAFVLPFLQQACLTALICWELCFLQTRNIYCLLSNSLTNACRFGLSALRSSSNILFTNGIYDPFTACGPTVNLSDSITATVYGKQAALWLSQSFETGAALPALFRHILLSAH